MDSFLGRALTDPATGLPNIPYFCLIQNWEERRARRRRTLVRVVRLRVDGGSDAARRSLVWRLCQDLRTSDLIASEGRDEFRILLTSPDAENAAAIAARVEHLAAAANEAHPPHGDTEEPIAVQADVDEPSPEGEEHGPCEPCREEEIFRATRDASGGAERAGDATERRDAP